MEATCESYFSGTSITTFKGQSTHVQKEYTLIYVYICTCKSRIIAVGNGSEVKAINSLRKRTGPKAGVICNMDSSISTSNSQKGG